MKKRKCEMCGEDISNRPSHHFLCYDCWKNRLTAGSVHIEASIDSIDDDSGRRFPKRYDPVTESYEVVNATYHERYRGTSYDMGPNWDYDEYPPENL